MRTSIFFILLFSVQSFSQSLTLPGFEKTPQIKQAIEFVEKHRDDTAFRGTLVPDAFGSDLLQHFPYPVLFVHGLAGGSHTWSEAFQYLLNAGWTYGGRTAFCLESDGNWYHSDIINGSSDIRNYANNVVGADFYVLDFNIDRLGQSTPNVPNLSAQAAIYKQGIGIRGAIASIIAATGRDKVILVCHSMGGLAVRHYLQNPSYWQADNKHHVAKLVTLNTPHGGSNATAGILSSMVSVIDEYSDAVRDLRRSYFYSGDPGVYLFGGFESEKVMNDNFIGFKNYDVNCNGYTGDQIQGLNQKNIPTNVDYSCVVSDWEIDGDGVVGFKEQNLKKYYNLPWCETFQKDVFHTAITAEMQTIWSAFDEPDYYNLSYWVQPNILYNGYITPQAPDALYNTMDYDDYFFFSPQPGWVEVQLGNLPVSPFGVSILNADEQILFDKEFNTLTANTGKVYLPSSGYYFLEVYAQGTSESWKYPYNFTLKRSGVTASNEAQDDVSLLCYPNPAKTSTSVSARFSEATEGLLVLSSLDGKELWSKQVNGDVVQTDIDLSPFAAGVYVLTLRTSSGVTATKVIKQ